MSALRQHMLPPSAVSVEEALGYLGAESDVPSTFGRQLEEQLRRAPSDELKAKERLAAREVKLARAGGQRATELNARDREDRFWNTIPASESSAGLMRDEEGRREMDLLRRARVLNCIGSLAAYRTIPFVACDDIQRFAKLARVQAGGVVVGVLRSFEAWRVHSKERGLAEVYAWMRAHAGINEDGEPRLPAASHNEESDAHAFRIGKAAVARRRASLLVADAEIVLSAWVDIWNRRAVGFYAVGE